ncbi:hypothetical protein DFJ73DRAFT_771599 [Zopfochytrium polystomum]|nr:hypothetical protein DFJ73DRAFT_771599 [Zopfochytrium polystomum]
MRPNSSFSYGSSNSPPPAGRVRSALPPSRLNSSSSSASAPPVPFDITASSGGATPEEGQPAATPTIAVTKSQGGGVAAAAAALSSPGGSASPTTPNTVASSAMNVLTSFIPSKMLSSSTSAASLVSTTSNGSSTASGAGPPAPTRRLQPSTASRPNSVSDSGSIGAEAVRRERERRESERKEKERLEEERKKQEALDEAREKARIAELRRKETEEEQLRKEQAKREVERRELDRVVARRTGDVVEREPVDESIITPQYVQNLMKTVEDDTAVAPTPEDFTYSDGFTMWQKYIGARLQNVLSDLLKNRFIDHPANGRRRSGPTISVELFFKVVQARGLQAKEGRTREAYCRIEFGNIPETTGSSSSAASSSASAPEVYMTEAISSNNPLWNQHLDLKVRSLSDSLLLSVWDRRKDYFLGRLRLNMGEVISAAARDGFMSRWYTLSPREGRNKDNPHPRKRSQRILSLISKPNFLTARSTSKHCTKPSSAPAWHWTCRPEPSLPLLLPPSALHHPVPTQRPAAAASAAAELLSPESKALLKVWARKWVVGEAFEVIAYLELLFNKYKRYDVPVWALLHAYETLYANMKENPDWLSVYDKPALVDLLEEMHLYYKTQVTKYKEFYQKNKPDEALESTILMLRMIFKNPVYRETHPNLPGSFRKEFRDIMVQACEERYHKLRALASPFDESDLEAVVEGLTKLAELLTEEVVADHRYFRRPFEMELDIVRSLSQTWIPTQKPWRAMQSSRVRVEVFFTLFKRLKVMNQKMQKYVTGLDTIKSYAGFNVEKWFAPFVSKWLDHLLTRTVGWVTSAVRADNFDPPVTDRNNDEPPPHSSSVTDLFSAVYSELEFIIDMSWSNEVQNAGFFQKFAKARDGVAPAEITRESCVKLCNLEYAQNRLDEMYKLMNVAVLTRTMRDYRATLAPSRHRSMQSLRRPGTAANTTDDEDDDEEDEGMKGAFKFQLSYAENLKPVNQSGSANAYVTIKVPEGTVVPPPDPDDLTVTPTGRSGMFGKSNNAASMKPITLVGALCELARTRGIPDTLNPTWDETFTTLLPPVPRIEVAVFSKNLVVSDELCGTGVIDLTKSGQLRTRLADHQTHDVFVELEPQGRVLIRVTLEGEEEDVDFWFRKTKERLNRTQDAFLRSLCAKISPYMKDVLTKAVKEHEAAPLAPRTFLSTFTSGVQYSNQTASGVAIDQLVTAEEADIRLTPLQDYLDKNLTLLCSSMSAPMAQAVIKRSWEDSLSTLEHLLVPPLYGNLEKQRRVLNKRQVSMVDHSVKILLAFIHSDGEGLGLPIRTLESRRWKDVTSLIASYGLALADLKREYELSLLTGREKEPLLRLLRLRFEKQEDLTPAEREEGRRWLETQLAKRRERRV